MRLRTAFLSLARERIVISEITITPQTEQTTADQVSLGTAEFVQDMEFAKEHFGK